MLASEVDLPEPVGPVTRISPRGRWINSLHRGGQADLLQVEDAPGDQSRDHADGPFLQKHADAEARILAEGQREIDAAVARRDCLM